MGTDLVTNKQIMPYKTTQGYRYLFKKDFLQQVQRIQQTNRHTLLRDTSTPKTSSTIEATSTQTKKNSLLLWKL